MDTPVQTLRKSQDGNELVVAALQVAKGVDGVEQETLRTLLQSAGFLSRLDGDESYNGPRRRLRLASVMRALAANQAEPARRTLITLTKAEIFVQEPARIELLIEAGAGVRPATPEFLAYWERFADPTDAYVPLVVTALLDNGTPPALALFEKLFANPAYDQAAKAGWLRKRLMPHRYEPHVLEACERMIAGSVPAPLRPLIVEALFDFRPEWYKPNVRITPPDVMRTNASVQRSVMDIAQRSLKVDELTDTQRDAVDRTLKRLATNEGSSAR